MPTIILASASLTQEIEDHYFAEGGSPFAVTTLSSRADYDTALTNISNTFAAGQNLKLVLHAHGIEEAGFHGRLGMVEGEAADQVYVHPTEMIYPINNRERSFLVDVYGCQVGRRMDKNDDTLIADYRDIRKGTTVILNAGHFDTLISISNSEFDKTHEETDPAKLFLKKMIYSPESLKFFSKPEDVIKFYKHSAIKPESSEDLSDAQIREFLEKGMKDFLEFYKREVQADINVETLLDEHKPLLTDAAIKEYRMNAFAIEISRQKTAYVRAYIDFGLKPEDTPVTMAHIEDLDLAEILLREGMTPEYNNSAVANCDKFFKRVFRSGNLRLMELLLGAEGSVNFLLNQEGETPLSFAAKTENVAGVKLLIARGANPRRVIREDDVTSEDPFAAAAGNKEILTILNEAAAAIEARMKARAELEEHKNPDGLAGKKMGRERYVEETTTTAASGASASPLSSSRGTGKIV